MIRQMEHAALSRIAGVRDKPSEDIGHLNTVATIVRDWDPAYIALACPFIVATLIGPSAINIASIGNQPNTANFLEMIKLILGRIGEFWELGFSVLSTCLPSPSCVFLIPRGSRGMCRTCQNNREPQFARHTS